MTAWPPAAMRAAEQGLRTMLGLDGTSIEDAARLACQPGDDYDAKVARITAARREHGLLNGQPGERAS